MPRAMVLMHDAANGPAAIARALAERGIATREVHGYDGTEIPSSPGDARALVVMGGPMAADDDALHPWLAREKALIRAAVEARVPVLGVCLGAQLVASALGGGIVRDGACEVGWYDVERTREAESDPLFGPLPARFTPFSWHSDAIVLPPGATLLARSRVAAVQGFRVGERVHGVQFHLELDRAAIAEWSREATDGIVGEEGAPIDEQERLAAIAFGAWAAKI